jgi:hypothetical protein
MTNLDQVLEHCRKSTVVFISLLCVVLVGIVDYLSGPELSASIFYLFPIYLAAWYASRRTGVAVSLVCGLSWYLADRLDGHLYLNDVIP